MQRGTIYVPILFCFFQDHLSPCVHGVCLDLHAHEFYSWEEHTVSEVIGDIYVPQNSVKLHV